MNRSLAQKLQIVLTGLILLSTLACGSKYNTNFPPPDPNQPIEQTFPAKIDELERTLEKMNLSAPALGYEARYGNGDIVIQMIHTESPPAADDLFKQTIVPTFDAMSNHFRGQVNGRWSASGKDDKGRIAYGWVNQNWIFVLNASDQKNFDKILSNFKFISK